MLNFTRNQVIIFVLLVILVLTTTCKEYYTDCNNIRGELPQNCQAMTVDQCKTWATNLGKDFQPSNDVFCGVIDTCPVGCYVHNSKVYYGADTNRGACSNQRICVQNSV